METIEIGGKVVSTSGLSILTQMPGQGWQCMPALLGEDEEGYYVSFALDGVVGAEDVGDLCVLDECEPDADGVYRNVVLYVASELREWYRRAKEMAAEPGNAFIAHLEEQEGLLDEDFEVALRPCPVCGSGLEVDLEYMQDNFGENWREIDAHHWTYYCPECGEAGTLGELEYIAEINAHIERMAE